MDKSKQRIKIAVQKTGRLTEHSLHLLERCGLKFTQSKDQLFCFGENMPIDLLLVRDDDIPGLVADDICDLGIVGLNVVEEKRLGREQEGREAPFDRVFDLDFGNCRRSFVCSTVTPARMFVIPHHQMHHHHAADDQNEHHQQRADRQPALSQPGRPKALAA